MDGGWMGAGNADNYLTVVGRWVCVFWRTPREVTLDSHSVSPWWIHGIVDLGFKKRGYGPSTG